MGKRKFTAEILSNESGGMYVIIPFDVEQEYGKKRVKILAKIETELYRGSIVRMGSPDHILLIRKDIREKIDKTVGDIIKIEVEEDTTPRVVKVPKDLQEIAGFRFLETRKVRSQVQFFEEHGRARTIRIPVSEDSNSVHFPHNDIFLLSHVR